MAESILSGWLEKKGAVNTAWKKRRFDLFPDRIEYRKAVQDEAPRGVIDLPGVTCRVEPPKGKEWQQRLAVQSGDGNRTYWLRGSLNATAEWKDAIMEQVKVLAGRGEGQQAVDAAGDGKKAAAEHSRHVELGEGSQLVQMQEEPDEQSEMVAQREAGMVKLEQDMTEINEMFQDLAGMITDQGDNLNTLHNNMDATAVRVQEGVNMLAVADGYGSKKKTRLGGPAKDERVPRPNPL